MSAKSRLKDHPKDPDSLIVQFKQLPKCLLAEKQLSPCGHGVHLFIHRESPHPALVLPIKTFTQVPWSLWHFLNDKRYTLSLSL